MGHLPALVIGVTVGSCINIHVNGIGILVGPKNYLLSH